MFKKILEWLQGNRVELTDEQKKDMEKLFPEGTPPAITPLLQDMSPAMKAFIEQLTTQNKALSEELKSVVGVMSEEKKAREESVKALEAKAAEDKKKKIDTKVEDMKKTGKIPAKNEELEKHYRKLLDADYDTAIAVIDGMPGKPGNETPAAVVAAPSQNDGDKRLAMIEAAKSAFKTNAVN